MNGITNIQNTLTNFMLRLDGQGIHIDELIIKIWAKNDINVRLENVQKQENDTLYIITEVQEKLGKMEVEIARLKDNLVKLESQVNSHNSQV